MLVPVLPLVPALALVSSCPRVVASRTVRVRALVLVLEARRWAVLVELVLVLVASVLRTAPVVAMAVAMVAMASHGRLPLVVRHPTRGRSTSRVRSGLLVQVQAVVVEEVLPLVLCVWTSDRRRRRSSVEVAVVEEEVVVVEAAAVVSVQRPVPPFSEALSVVHLVAREAVVARVARAVVRRGVSCVSH